MTRNPWSKTTRSIYYLILWKKIHWYFLGKTGCYSFFTVKQMFLDRHGWAEWSDDTWLVLMSTATLLVSSHNKDREVGVSVSSNCAAFLENYCFVCLQLQNKYFPQSYEAEASNVTLNWYLVTRPRSSSVIHNIYLHIILIRIID